MHVLAERQRGSVVPTVVQPQSVFLSIGRSLGRAKTRSPSCQPEPASMRSPSWAALCRCGSATSGGGSARVRWLRVHLGSSWISPRRRWMLRSRWACCSAGRGPSTAAPRPRTAAGPGRGRRSRGGVADVRGGFQDGAGVIEVQRGGDVAGPLRRRVDHVGDVPRDVAPAATSAVSQGGLTAIGSAAAPVTAFLRPGTWNLRSGTNGPEPRAKVP